MDTEKHLSQILEFAKQRMLYSSNLSILVISETVAIAVFKNRAQIFLAIKPYSVKNKYALRSDRGHWFFHDVPGFNSGILNACGKQQSSG